MKCRHCGSLMLGRKRKYCDSSCRNSIGRKYDKECKQCNRSFQSPRKITRFCSLTCHRLYQYRDSKWKQLFKCKQCNKEFRVKPSGGKNATKGLFCGRSCAFAYRAEHSHYGEPRGDVVVAIAKAISDGMLRAKLAWKTCRICGSSYWVSAIRKTTGCCSYRCYKNSLTITDENHCNRCGALLDRDGNRCKSCFTELRRLSRRTAKESRTWRKKARKYGVEYQLIHKRTIFKRDAWRCHICGKKTKPQRHWLHPLYPTLDHIVPISRGGPHIESNVACAHRRCNTRKNIRRLGNLRLKLK